MRGKATEWNCQMFFHAFRFAFHGRTKTIFYGAKGHRELRVSAWKWFFNYRQFLPFYLCSNASRGAGGILTITNKTNESDLHCWGGLIARRCVRDAVLFRVNIPSLRQCAFFQWLNKLWSWRAMCRWLITIASKIISFLPPLFLRQQIKDELCEVVQEMESHDSENKHSSKEKQMSIGRKKFNMDPKKGERI